MSFFNSSFNNDNQDDDQNPNITTDYMQQDNAFNSFLENEPPAFGGNNNINASFGGNEDEGKKMDEESFGNSTSFNMDVNQNKSVSQDSLEAFDLEIPHEIISYANSLRNPNSEINSQGNLEVQSCNNKILDFITKIQESMEQHTSKFAKMQIEQKEFKYKLVLEHSKRSYLI